MRLATNPPYQNAPFVDYVAGEVFMRAPVGENDVEIRFSRNPTVVEFDRFLEYCRLTRQAISDPPLLSKKAMAGLSVLAVAFESV